MQMENWHIVCEREQNSYSKTIGLPFLLNISSYKCFSKTYTLGSPYPLPLPQFPSWTRRRPPLFCLYSPYPHPVTFQTGVRQSNTLPNYVPFLWPKDNIFQCSEFFYSHFSTHSCSLFPFPSSKGFLAKHELEKMMYPITYVQ